MVLHQTKRSRQFEKTIPLQRIQEQRRIMSVFFSLLYRNASLIYCIVANWQSEWVPEGTKNTLSPANALSLVRSFPTGISLSPSEEQLINKQVGSLALGPVFRGLLRWFWKNWAWGVAQHKQLWAGAVNTSWQVRLWWSCAAAGCPPGPCFVSGRKALNWARLAPLESWSQDLHWLWSPRFHCSRNVWLSPQGLDSLTSPYL